jgi:hypothetical protein
MPDEGHRNCDVSAEEVFSNNGLADKKKTYRARANASLPTWYVICSLRKHVLEFAKEEQAAKF